MFKTVGTISSGGGSFAPSRRQRAATRLRWRRRPCYLRTLRRRGTARETAQARRVFRHPEGGRRPEVGQVADPNSTCHLTAQPLKVAKAGGLSGWKREMQGLAWFCLRLWIHFIARKVSKEWFSRWNRWLGGWVHGGPAPLVTPGLVRPGPVHQDMAWPCPSGPVLAWPSPSRCDIN